MFRPLVSIGLPVYNGEAYLEQALSSWCEQSFSDYELLISDNASTDRTEELCRTFAETDDRIVYHRNDRNVGAAANFNSVFHRARGEYFKWAAHDDYVAPTFLEQCLEAFVSHPAAVIAYAPPVLVDEAGQRLPYRPDRRAYVDRHGKAWHVHSGTEDELASPDPIERFRAIMEIHSIYCFELLGLIRRHALDGSSLIASYYGSDRALLAELSLKGPFVTPSGSELLFRRCHPAQPTHSLTPDEQWLWIRGEMKATSVPPQWHLFADYLRLARDAALPLPMRLQLASTVLQRAVRPEKLRRLIVPGEDNYFGIGRRVHPAASTPH